ncbi:hypothetical protein H5410_042487 [Solanum commersonii]|uniref:Uncharacterized protein n=1 Tax=Solanum commersonii TaxID=4109 RepID=A0A9J5XVU2_SOLCO|nr:hypothetical protein H5410_042487 [Solanum commersonii]
MQLSHVSYSKLRVMMEKSMLKGLPKFLVRTDVICASCQYDGAEGEADEDNVDEFVAQNPWQTGMYKQPGEEGELIEADSPPPLRRSTRTRKQNPKFANAAIIDYHINVSFWEKA